MRRTMICLTACLVLSGCAGTTVQVPDGQVNFCDVVTREKTFVPDTARQIVLTDRATAEQIEFENGVFEAEC
ncbi:hypothetical protein [Roseobacter sp. TSBP12]|uniref:hypothetical protein n=1 Tax=Roseobacter sp. TSBP12 TaxID=1236613 RepID=UPI00125EFF21|nr:hypothetical protein [Roseobacter sp. TSBP12]